jgi:hypothetical protein
MKAQKGDFMFMLLEVDEYTNKWKQVVETTTFDSKEEAEAYAKEQELFDVVMVQFVKFV